MEGLAEIRCATVSVESKLSTLITRMDEVEKLVDYLDTAERERQANPPAGKTNLLHGDP